MCLHIPSFKYDIEKPDSTVLFCPPHITYSKICKIIKTLKNQPHEGELTGEIVDDLRIRLIRGEQVRFPVHS